MFILKKIFTKYGIMTAGALLFALAVNLFLVPSKIVTGGLSGIATIFFHTLGVNTAIVIALGNIILIVCAWLLLGGKFVVNSLYGMVASTLLISLTEFIPPVTHDLILSSIFGGIILGIGIGLTFVQEGTTGGTDILSRIFQHYFPHFSIGSLMMAVDFVIMIISYIVFRDTELIMYGVISLFVTNAVIDGIIAHLNKGVLVFIITRNSEKLKQAIIDNLERGVTVLEGYGGYSREKKNVLMCVMKKSDLESLKRFIDSKEETFMIVTSSKEVLGEGFRYYK